MTIKKELEGNKLMVAVEGRLDTVTSPELDQLLKESLEGIEALELDLTELQYISSAGLRVLLSAQKTMNKQGKMTIKNVCPEIMDIFDVTGFVDILNIEN